MRTENGSFSCERSPFRDSTARRATSYYPLIRFAVSPAPKSELPALLPAERILPLTEILDRTAAEPHNVPLSDEQRTELDRRIDALDRIPDSDRPWSEVRTELLGR